LNSTDPKVAQAVSGTTDFAFGRSTENLTQQRLI
jgi:hypothetical protein